VSRPGQTTRWIVIALGITVLTAAGHGAAGGRLPHVGAVGALFLLGAALAVPLAQRRRSLLGLAVCLAAAQIVGHVVLTVTDSHGHAHGLLPGPGMLAAHALAALGVAAVVAWADDLVAAFAALARGLLGPASALVAVSPRLPASPVDASPIHLRSLSDVRGPVWHRGPPTCASLAVP
jgi:hypothetical protein